MKENNNNNTPEPVPDSETSSLMPVENLIYVIRGQQVMLDRDLAKLYGVETKVLTKRSNVISNVFPRISCFA